MNWTVMIVQPSNVRRKFGYNPDQGEEAKAGWGWKLKSNGTINKRSIWTDGVIQTTEKSQVDIVG